jgi:hypothetical protein
MRNSDQVGSPLHEEEHIRAEGLDHMYGFERWDLPFPNGPYVRDFEACRCGSRAITGKTLRSRRDTD